MNNARVIKKQIQSTCFFIPDLVAPIVLGNEEKIMEIYLDVTIGVRFENETNGCTIVTRRG